MNSHSKRIKSAFMVVMSDKGNTFNVPEQYSPHYLMDSLGFYRNGVSGKFPKDLTSEEKGQFAKEMVELCAVGFRRGEDGGGGGGFSEVAHKSDS